MILSNGLKVINEYLKFQTFVFITFIVSNNQSFSIDYGLI